MNKAKFLLSAVALVAVIGAVTSGKATPQDRIFTTDVKGACPSSINATLEPNANPLGIVYASLVNVCPDLHTIYQPL